MTLTYRDHTFASLPQYIAARKRSETAGRNIDHYAVPMDGWIIKTLNSTPVKAMIGEAFDLLVNAQFGSVITAGIPVSHRSYSDVYAVLVHCSGVLGIARPRAIVSSFGGLNAYTSGTDKDAFINISSELCRATDTDELTFVLGHECGHIAAHHAMYQTLVNLLTNAALSPLGAVGAQLGRVIGIPLLAWSRRAEATADRAGLVCCGDLRTAERGLVRLVAGGGDLSGIDIEDFLDGVETEERLHPLSTMGELMTSHPQIPKRIRALRVFANSELYYQVTGTICPSDKRLWTRDELDRQVGAIVKP